LETDYTSTGNFVKLFLGEARNATEALKKSILYIGRGMGGFEKPYGANFAREAITLNPLKL